MKIIEVYSINRDTVTRPLSSCSEVDFSYARWVNREDFLIESYPTGVANYAYTKERARVKKFVDVREREATHKWIAIEPKLEEMLTCELRQDNALLKRSLRDAARHQRDADSKGKKNNAWRHRNIFYRIFYAIFKSKVYIL